MENCECEDARGIEGWTCRTHDGTGLWCDTCLKFDSGFSITTEQDHRHECPHCHGTWLHANDGCECNDLFPQWMVCPGCERG